MGQIKKGERPASRWIAAALGLAALAGDGFAAPPTIRPAPLTLVRDSPVRVDLVALEATDPARGSKVLLADGSGPLGWVFADGNAEHPSRFAGTFDVSSDVRNTLRGWVVMPSYFRDVQEHLPPGAELAATVENFGPGETSAWLSLGSDHGIAVGDRFWRRENGQPVVRLDVRLVDSQVCFCRVFRLAAGAQLVVGDKVTLWPDPARRRTNRSSTAVCYVEGAASGSMIWVAAPLDVSTPDEPRVDFFRNGRYVGFGIVERRDPRFWYVRPLLPACIEPIRVGDDGVIRTTVDVREQSYSARVFSQTNEGCLITAGEPDGISAGQIGLLLRVGVPIGRVEVKRVQGGYATCVRLTERKNAGQPALVAEVESSTKATMATLDEVRFGPPRGLTEAVGIVIRVVGSDLFSAELSISENPQGPRAFGVRQNGRFIGVAVVVGSESGHATGFVVPETMTEALAPGDELVATP